MPAEQFVQEGAPAEYFPWVHIRHEVDPETSWYLPAEQDAHFVALAALEYMPPAHLVQLADPLDPENVPALQFRQVL